MWFFWSVHGETLFLARQLAREGEDVQLYCQSPQARFVGRNIVPRAPSSLVPGGALVLFDVVGKGAQGTALRRSHRVIGGNPFDRDLELDRTKGTKLMQEIGIAIPETHTFSSIPDAMKFLRTEEGSWFFKPSGNEDTSLTHGAPTSEDMLRFLAWASQHNTATSFELQRKVEGVEISCEGWFDGDRFVLPFNSTFEDKKFLTGDLGPNTGCQTNVVWIWPDDAPLPQETVARLAPRLRRERYVGPIDLNMIVDKDGTPRGLEWSARTGFDALQAYTRLLKPPLGEQLRAFVEGRLERWQFIDDPLALTLRITVPPFPFDDAQAMKEVQGLPLDPMVLADVDHTLIDDVMLTEAGPALAGRDGGVCVLAETGDDMDTMREDLLERAKALVIPSAQYRTDVMERAEQDWDRLADLGFAAPEV